MKCITGKICYKDRLDAIIALSRIQEQTKKMYKKEWHYPIRAYHCNLCQYWHLTSKPDFKKEDDQSLHHP